MRSLRRINAAGSALIYSTYLSGNFGARGFGIAANNSQGIRLRDRHDQHWLSGDGQRLRIDQFQLRFPDQADARTVRAHRRWSIQPSWPTPAPSKDELSPRMWPATFMSPAT